MALVEIKPPELNIPAEALGFFQRVLGPLAEAGDFLSDKIRFYRWRSSLAALEQAQRIAAEHGVNPKEIPLKTLVPLLEKASLEDEKSPLLGRWATLLASASYDPDHVRAVYSEILSRLSLREIEILEGMVTPDHEKDFTSITIIGYAAGYRKALTSALREAIDGSGDTVEYVDELLKMQPRATFVESVEIVDRTQTAKNLFRTHKVLIDDLVSYEVLTASGLLARHATSFIAGNDDVTVITLSLTPLAVEFVRACRGDCLPQTVDSRV